MGFYHSQLHVGNASELDAPRPICRHQEWARPRQRRGRTLTRYRRQIRMRQALQRLADGDSDLARLAADLGFSDQAHLRERTPRQRPPRRCRYVRR
ncbi:MAG TPA: helix-turn-helix domain-containing protein [Actinomycetota bacterium]|nr:helix-turn-helix domain-containing protein [Actinomycetota bacterium]